MRLREARVRETIRIRGALVWAERGLVPDFEIPVRLAGEVWPGELLEDGRPWPEPKSRQERFHLMMWRWHIWSHEPELDKHLYTFIRAEVLGKKVPHPADPVVWPDEMINPPPTRARIFPEGTTRICYAPVPPVAKPRVGVSLKKSVWRVVKGPLKILALVAVVIGIFGNFGEGAFLAFILAVIFTFFGILKGKR